MEPDLMDTETPDYFSFLGKGQAPKKKRKRGGLAGLWDRNKNVIKPLATAVAGAVTGGAAVPALLGAAMGGLDRPGKRGVGFDLGGAARGGLAGALAGKVGSAAGMGAAGARGAGLNPLWGAARGVKEAATDAFTGATQVGGQMASGGATPAGGAAPSAVAQPQGLAKALQFIAQNPQPIGMGLQAASGIIGAQEQRRIEEERQKEDRRRAENLARLAMPMYVDSFRGRR